MSSAAMYTVEMMLLESYARNSGKCHFQIIVGIRNWNFGRYL